MLSSFVIARRLAAAMLAGDWELDQLVERGGRILGKRWRWLRPLARRIIAAFAGQFRPAFDALAQFIDHDPSFQRACKRQMESDDGILIFAALLPRPAMNARHGPPAQWRLPDLPTPGSLADWLKLSPGELDWFADCQGREQHWPAGPLRHYRYRWVPKRSGGLRLIETPKARLKAIQRRLLHELLDEIPPHDAAHGFRRGRSIKSYVLPHVGLQVVIRLDLQDFFTSIHRARIIALFLTAGYPEPVATLLAGLCTNSVPRELWTDPTIERGTTDARRHRALQQPHLPQGAPTSPALANLCAFRLDVRLSGLAAAAAANYTRYADDLVFSGGEELARSARRFHIQAAAIALEEGFSVNFRKTRIMRQSVRQQIAGVVVNEKPNIRRRDYDELKAILHNCARGDPASQNRAAVGDFRAHLLGRIEHIRMLHPQRGAKLHKLFAAIKW